MRLVISLTEGPGHGGLILYSARAAFLALGPPLCYGSRWCRPDFSKEPIRAFPSAPKSHDQGGSMLPQKLPVVFSLSRAPDSGWTDIASGWWKPASGWLDIEGEKIPEQVLNELASVDPVGTKGGQAETRYGDFRYRMIFGRDAKEGPTDN